MLSLYGNGCFKKMQEKLNFIKAMWKEAETLADPAHFYVFIFLSFLWGKMDFVPKKSMMHSFEKSWIRH